MRFDTLADADAAAQADRAVVEGLLQARTRPWLVGLSRLDLDATTA